MIISASRRTDIPALYPEWFMNRLLEGEVLVPNPYNRKRVSRIKLSPEIIDCVVFWSRNPEPMLPYLKMLDTLGYSYYFEMTITDCGKEAEGELPSMEEAIATFMLLSERIGRSRLDWRYDPIILNEDYPLEYHLEKFEMMCQWIHKYTDRCIVSFADCCKANSIIGPDKEDVIEAAKGLVKIADRYRLPLYACAEKLDLREYGIYPGACIDREKIEDVVGYKLDIKKDRGQRRECGCVESVDIGMFDTCIHGCHYCYANGSVESVARRRRHHDPNSPMLFGNLRGDETIVDRRMSLRRDNQMSIFEFL